MRKFSQSMLQKKKSQISLARTAPGAVASNLNLATPSPRETNNLETYGIFDL
jgi:hypothetical protein